MQSFGWSEVNCPLMISCLQLCLVVLAEFAYNCLYLLVAMFHSAE